jgi:hypothetical protein
MSRSAHDDDDEFDSMSSVSSSSSSSTSSSSSDDESTSESRRAASVAPSLALTKQQMLAEQAILARLLAANEDLASAMDLRAPIDVKNPDKAGDARSAAAPVVMETKDRPIKLPPDAAPILPILPGKTAVVYEQSLPPPPPPVDDAPPDFPMALLAQVTAPASAPSTAAVADFSADDLALQLSSPPSDVPLLKPLLRSAPALVPSLAAHGIMRSVSQPVDLADQPLSPRSADSPPLSPAGVQAQRRRLALRAEMPPTGVIQAAVGSPDANAADVASAVAAAAATAALGDKACQSCKKRKYQARATQRDGTTRLLCKQCVVDVQRVQQVQGGGADAADADAAAADWWRAASGRFRAKRQVERDASAAKREPACGSGHHSLELARLSHASWCHVSHTFLWLPDGVDVARCTAPRCTFVAHLACVGGADGMVVSAATCPTSAGPAYDAYSGAAFGVSLADACLGRRNSLPIVVQDVVLFLLAHCGGEEGLLRHSGSHTLIQQLARQYNGGGAVQLAGVEAHTVAGLLKLFFRELKDKLIPDALDDQIAERLSQAKARQESGAQVALYLRDALQKLPRPNYELCKFLSFFFLSLELRVGENKMSQSNILLVVAPTLQCTMGIFVHTMRHYEAVFGAPPNFSQLKAASNSKFASFDAIKH